MRVLVIDEAAKAKVMRVKEHALSNRRTLHDIMRAMQGKDIPGDDSRRVMCLFDGYKVVYSIEQQPKGWCHHISVGIIPKSYKELYPHETAIQEILKLFGLPPLEQAVFAYAEDVPEGQKALNLLFKFNESDL